MNENIDLTKILKDCPIGTEFYHAGYGKVWFCGINLNNNYPILLSFDNNKINTFGVTSKGTVNNTYEGECLLFPSKEERDWSKFTASWYKEEKLVKPKFKVGDRVRRKGTNKDNVYEITKVYDESYGIAGLNLVIYMKYQDQYELVHNKFDPKTLKPFDKVIGKFNNNSSWTCDLFSNILEFDNPLYKCIGNYYQKCIPYNDETKHLVGTYDDTPEYYRYWESE